MFKVTKDILKDIYKKRPKTSHKYNFGLLLIIGGSEFYSGSPALSAMAALRTGVDMVHIIAPKRAADIIASFSPNLAVLPLNSQRLQKRDLALMLTMVAAAERVAPQKTAIVIGGGLGREKETQETILEFLSKISIPAVVDADAIHAVSKNPKVVSEKRFIITPHLQEFYVLTGKKIFEKSLKEKEQIVFEEANRFKATILLKGPVDIISDGKEIALNKTGNSYMTKGGTGDTLAGICGSLLAQGISSFKAAQGAAYINGKAGDIASKTLKAGLLATDLIEAIPKVLP